MKRFLAGDDLRDFMERNETIIIYGYIWGKNEYKPI